MTRSIRLPAIALIATFALGQNAYAALDPAVSMDETLQPMDNITLSFTAPVIIDQTTVHLFGSKGPVAIGELRRGTDPSEVVVPVSSDLPAGVYFIHFNAHYTSGLQMTGTYSVHVPDRSYSQQINYAPFAGALDKR
jgi:methionine-rich copper-binding protein CopC